MRIFLIIVALLVLMGGGAYAWYYFGGFDGDDAGAIAFIDAYGAYSEAALKVDALTHAPTVEQNEGRVDLLERLTSILTGTLTAAERESQARAAFGDLDALKREIDAAQAAHGDLYKTQRDLEAAGVRLANARSEAVAKEILALARSRTELAISITSLVSENHDHMYAILTRILDERGELSQEHVIQINASTDGAEARRDELERSYEELVRIEAETRATFARFVAVAM